MRPIAGTVTDPALDHLIPNTRAALDEAFRDVSASLVEDVVPDVSAFNEYQAAAAETAVYPRVYTEDQVREMLSLLLEAGGILPSSFAAATTEEVLDKFETPFNRLVYPVLGLVGEAGEIANKLKKVARDDQGQMDMDKSVEIQGETGDVLWYVARIASELNTPLERIAYANVRKLFSRKARGVLGGSGDNR